MKTWTRFQIVYFFLVLTSVVDYISTLYGVAHVHGYEQNPLVLWALPLIGWPGIGFVLALSLLAGYGTVWGLRRLGAQNWITTFIVIYATITIIHSLLVAGNIYGLATR